MIALWESGAYERVKDLLGGLGNFEFFLPYVALAELHAGAYKALRSERNLQQIALFLDAVDGLLPDEETPGGHCA